ncbi:MAG: hypothetical protein NZ879_02250 [Archaeoglobaceae archaeon]|nr:hypothetical protein [Archaeoglobaceae archaeon]MDW8117786.1 hypothetical protein [Archaeoglobaceae archaeon]
MDKLSEKAVILFIPPAIFFTARAILDPENVFDYIGNYTIHALLYFLSFLLFPAFYLYLKNEALGLFCSKKAFLAGLIAYLPFLPLFLLLFGPILGATGKGLELIKTLFLICLNVSAVDFYVWRVWQANFNKYIGFLVWLLVHIPESTILAPHGIFKVIIFMVASGAVFSTVYDKYKCVGGLIAGHVAINVGMAIIRGEWW